MERLRPVARQLRREPAPFFLCVYLEVAFPLAEASLDQRRQLGQRAGAENDIDPGHVLPQPLAVALGDAATDADDAPSRRRLWCAHHGRCLSVEARIGVLAHAAGHVDDDIRFLGSLHGDAPARVEQAGYPLGIMKVHLTTERLDKISTADKDGLPCWIRGHDGPHYASVYW